MRASPKIEKKRRRKRSVQLVSPGWTWAEVQGFHREKLECFRIMAERTKVER